MHFQELCPIYNNLSYPAHFQALFYFLSGRHQARKYLSKCSGISRGLSPWNRYAVCNFDSTPLHLSRGLSPYVKTETEPGKNASTLPELCLCFPARLIAITKALTSQCITDSMFLLVLTDLRGFLFR